MLPRTHHFFHAPWSKWFRTFYLRGSWAHEVQIGPVVVQVPRKGKAGRSFKHRNGPVHVWSTRYWR